jgi:hypothetical protein
MSFLFPSPLTFLFYRCTQILNWTPIPIDVLKGRNRDGIYDRSLPVVNGRFRRRIDLDTYPLLDDHDAEIPIYDKRGKRIARRIPHVGQNPPQCGVLVDLEKVQALFNPGGQLHRTVNDNDNDNDPDFDTSALPESHFVNVDVYPLGFLRTVGNVQATGVPHSFYPVITDINQNVRRNPDRRGHGFSVDPDDPDDNMSLDVDQDRPQPRGAPVVRPVASQFYNYVADRTATRARRQDAQQGSVTAALAGTFAETDKHKEIASDQQRYCDHALPSDRFHTKISIRDRPPSCRAEFVYSVDVRALETRTGMSVFISSSASAYR